MNYQDVLNMARDQMGPFCKSCPVCNGRACGSTMPGPGAKGSGTVFIRNYQKWQEIRLNLDAIHENKEPDTRFSLFGETFSLPVFAAPIGAMKMHYGDKYDDMAYNNLLLPAAIEAGIAAFTGDGVNPAIMQAAAQTLKKYQGKGIATIKPWAMEVVREKLEMVKEARPMAIAMDIDAAGLPFLKGQNPPAGSKTVQELEQIVAWAERPFILKGIMTAAGAKKAMDAGVSAIVVSNHGGRVLDHCPGTAEVLPEIVEAVNGKVKVLVDGGIRSGLDVFKALALGADAVLIGRPFVNMIYGAGAEGVRVYVEKLASELADTMTMCGAASLEEINGSMVRV